MALLDWLSGIPARTICVKYAFLVALCIVVSACSSGQNEVSLPLNPTSGAGLNYPYKTVPNDPRLNMPWAEGRQSDMDTDTWFLEGVLEGKKTGKRYSFIVVYYVSKIFGMIPLQFYSIAVYDLADGDYGTYTKYGAFSIDAREGYLDLRIPVNSHSAQWVTSRDTNGHLRPFAYSIDLYGTDQKQRDIHLKASVKAKNPPVPVGANILNGKITVFTQPDTYSYFQTGLNFDGTLDWGHVSEEVTGHLGHIDRQMFPKFVGLSGGRDGRNFSHEWRTYFLDNGLDFSSWRQFDREHSNAITSFNGATIYVKGKGPGYADDVKYETLSYRRVENHAVKPLVPARAEVLYFPDRHRLSSESLGLSLESEPIIKETPLLSFPVEYVHGPVSLSGSYQGKPVHGIGSFERTLGLYRDFELAQVLRDSLANLPDSAFEEESKSNLLSQVELLQSEIKEGKRAGAKSTGVGTLSEQIQSLAEPYRSKMIQILEDVNSVL